jgi:hypothetical protein
MKLIEVGAHEPHRLDEGQIDRRTVHVEHPVVAKTVRAQHDVFAGDRVAAGLECGAALPERDPIDGRVVDEAEPIGVNRSQMSERLLHDERAVDAGLR